MAESSYTTSYSTLCIELDCLVDTRFSTLATFDKEIVKKVLLKNYHDRKIDDFPGIDKEEFKKRYKERDKLVLKNAIGTPLVQMVTEFSRETQSLIENTPHHFIPRIWINTYPYLLSPEEEKVLLNSFSEISEGKAIVELIFKSKEELTPSFVKNEISILVLYEYYEWLEIHSQNENFKKITCPQVTLIGPAIYFKSLPTAKDLQLEKEAKVNAFRAMELTAAPLIGLVLLPINNFSMAFKPQRHNPT